MTTPKTTAPWADTPYALLPIPGTSMPGARTTTNAPILRVAVEMANVHNALLRSLNAIYQQAPHIHNARDITDFIFYAATWQETIHHHHSVEESIFFPAADELARAAMGESVMEANVEQHRAFEQGLEEFKELVDAVQEGKVEYDGAALQRCIDGFAPVLTAHLHDEIATILKLEPCDGDAVERSFKQTTEEGGKTADPNRVIPLFLGSIDKSYPGSENFPPLPFFVPWLNAYWFSSKHQGSWRFNPCDHWSRARPLQFLGQVEE